MEVSDFKKYALKIIEQDSINSNYKDKKYRLAYVYSESSERIILSQLGFNSLVKGDVFDSMIEKFAETPETKEVFLKMSKRKK